MHSIGWCYLVHGPDWRTGRTIMCWMKMHRPHKIKLQMRCGFSAVRTHFFLFFFFHFYFVAISKQLSRNESASRQVNGRDRISYCVQSSAHFDDCIVMGCAQMIFGGISARFLITSSWNCKLCGRPLSIFKKCSEAGLRRIVDMTFQVLRGSN